MSDPVVSLRMELPAGSITLRVRNATIPALMKARVHALRTNKEDNAIRRELVAKAAAIEPDNPEVWLYQAWGHWREYQNGWSDDREASFDKAAELAEKADAADPGDSAITGFLGVSSLSRGRHEEAIAYGRKSVELAPSSALNNARLAWFLSVSGYPEEAIPPAQKAMRLSPSYPAWFAGVLGFAYMLTEDYEKAIAAYEQLRNAAPSAVEAVNRAHARRSVRVCAPAPEGGDTGSGTLTLSVELPLETGELVCQALDKAVESVKRVSCDGSVVPMVDGAKGEPLNVGRKQRTVPAALKRALWARDGGCSFPGCTHTRFVDAHHIRHWADGGETSLENTMLLCGGHHRLVHEGGYAIRKDHRGRWYFMRPDGRAIPQYGYQPDDMVDEGLGDGSSMDSGGDSAEAPEGWRVTPHSTGVREAAVSYVVAL